ncbi:hypothetical protein HF086_001412 [Spodoptera exigua]|uniref:LysM domain-containing protein n=1 Tax=Spodoptera exigua TaxID=7107 RepID=A0A922MC37_SPOEX|nr:hypothetical protein HF086_001412 [Spodoptera exigua]
MPVSSVVSVACRSRRASQQLSRSAESIDQSFKRSKSRSVDHGFSPPFDLEALRSKVEGRFDAVHRDEDEHAKRLPPPPPIKTMTYTVRDRDTLTSLAARFDTTPSELTKLNRLATQFIFPGQTLLVPDKRKDGDKDSDGPSESGDNTSESTQGPPSEPAQEKEILESLRPGSPEAPTSSCAPQRFLKINVRHITDGQGVVSGVLLVTPNAVMFDPNVSDTLVMEHGPESYGVIAPMEYVVNAAIFYDIAHMRTHGPDHNTHNSSRSEVTNITKDETFPELQAATGESADGEPAADARPGDEAEDRGGAAFPKAFDRELVTPTALQQQSTEDRRKSLLDQHWAIPSKDRMSIDQGRKSLLFTQKLPPPIVLNVELCLQISSTADAGKEETTGPEPEAADSIAVAEGSDAGDAGEAPDHDAQHLVKLSYHDSGIDIRDPLLHVTPANSKKGSLIDCDEYYHEIDTIYESKELEIDRDWHRDAAHALQCFLVLHKNADARSDSVYSSCDEVRGDDVILVPTKLSKCSPISASHRINLYVFIAFSKQMLKRLSYPLSWVEGLTGEGGAQGSQSDSLPTSADSHNSTSVFSKVFNRYVLYYTHTTLILGKILNSKQMKDLILQQLSSSTCKSLLDMNDVKLSDNTLISQQDVLSPHYLSANI